MAYTYGTYDQDFPPLSVQVRKVICFVFCPPGASLVLYASEDFIAKNRPVLCVATRATIRKSALTSTIGTFLTFNPFVMKPDNLTSIRCPFWSFMSR